jgi:hypothetical protein
MNRGINEGKHVIQINVIIVDATCEMIRFVFPSSFTKIIGIRSSTSKDLSEFFIATSFVYHDVNIVESSHNVKCYPAERVK